MSVVPTQVPKPVNPHSQTYFQKGWEKCKQQPFVPLGILATCVAFGGATYHLRSGNRQSFNRFLRFRVIAQGVTIAGCVVGSYIYGQQAVKEKEKKRAIEVENIKLAGSAPLIQQQLEASGKDDRGDVLAAPTGGQKDALPTPKLGITGDRVLSQLGVRTKRND